MMRKRLTQIFLVSLMSIVSVNAQVTIGSDETPVQGALLDLKESGNTTKGLGLPRVKLTNRAPKTDAELPVSIGTYNIRWDLTEHIGLVV